MAGNWTKHPVEIAIVESSPTWIAAILCLPMQRPMAPSSDWMIDGPHLRLPAHGAHAWPGPSVMPSPGPTVSTYLPTRLCSTSAVDCDRATMTLHIAKMRSGHRSAAGRCSKSPNSFSPGWVGSAQAPDRTHDGKRFRPSRPGREPAQHCPLPRPFSWPPVSLPSGGATRLLDAATLSPAFLSVTGGAWAVSQVRRAGLSHWACATMVAAGRRRAARRPSICGLAPFGQAQWPISNSRTDCAPSPCACAMFSCVVDAAVNLES